jgi:prolipoprotein diacylglyceryl transferase
VVSAIFITRRRFKELELESELIAELAIWVIPSGVIGGRLYHVITSPQRYFGASGDPWAALRIWDGGMGIWGAVALGVLAARLVFNSRPRSFSFSSLLDYLAPGLAAAQSLGRWGNWFNGELFGRPLARPWALAIPFQDRPIKYSAYASFHPTFLYESLWCALLAALLWRARHKGLEPGELFLIYICGYSLGRIYFEWLRIDPANQVLGLRLNLWVAMIATIWPAAILIRRRLAAR